MALASRSIPVPAGQDVFEFMHEKGYSDGQLALPSPLCLLCRSAMSEQVQHGLPLGPHGAGVRVRVPSRSSHRAPHNMRPGARAGFPLVPPTPARVKSILEGTLLKPDRMLGILPPNKGELTVELVVIRRSLPALARPGPTHRSERRRARV